MGLKNVEINAMKPKINTWSFSVKFTVLSENEKQSYHRKHVWAEKQEARVLPNLRKQTKVKNNMKNHG